MPSMLTHARAKFNVNECGSFASGIESRLVSGWSRRSATRTSNNAGSDALPEQFAPVFPTPYSDLTRYVHRLLCHFGDGDTELQLCLSICLFSSTDHLGLLTSCFRAAAAPSDWNCCSSFLAGICRMPLRRMISFRQLLLNG